MDWSHKLSYKEKRAIIAKTYKNLQSNDMFNLMIYDYKDQGDPQGGDRDADRTNGAINVELGKELERYLEKIEDRNDETIMPMQRKKKLRKKKGDSSK